MATSPSDTNDAQSVATIRPEISRIIDSGRQADVVAGSAKPVAAMGLATGVLSWFSFSPMEFAPLAWIALVPVCLLLRVRRLPRLSHRTLYLTSFVVTVAMLQWMRLGHVSMYGALTALAFYLAFYLPVFVAVGRRLVFAGCPVWLAAPVVWTSLEYVRAYLLTGFSWYYLGHSQYQWTTLVQISDITGAYGVSFLVALSSGVLASLVPSAAIERLGLGPGEDNLVSVPVRGQRIAVATLCVLVGASCLYGVNRTLADEDASAGPVIAVVQGNFTPEVKHDPGRWMEIVRVHDLLSRRAAGLRPDLIVWPETMFPARNRIIGDRLTDDDLAEMIPPNAALDSEQVRLEIKRWRDGYARELLANRSQEAGAAMLVGLITEEADADGKRQYNSAAFVRPDLGYVGRYDKRHRVIFGEYIPLKNVMPFLAKASPYGGGFGIDAGESASVFEYGDTRFAPIICFEDTVPQLVRNTVLTEYADGSRPDVLINMTNDGWFRGSSELDQHLITATFRCIETRRPMIRAVNGGISAFIDSSGRIRQPEHFLMMDEETAGVAAEFTPVESMIDEKTGRRHRQCSAVMCGQIPLDGRNTVYLAFGDWFAILCSLATIAGVVTGRIRRTSVVADSQTVPAASVSLAA